MDILIQFILVHYGFILLGEKYGVRQKIGATRFKMLYELSECLFCYTHTIGVILLIFLILSNGFSFVYLLYPFMSTSALFLINKQRI